MDRLAAELNDVRIFDQNALEAIADQGVGRRVEKTTVGRELDLGLLQRAVGEERDHDARL